MGGGKAVAFDNIFTNDVQLDQLKRIFDLRQTQVLVYALSIQLKNL